MIDKLRRVVTGHNAEGRSIVALDGPPRSIVETRSLDLVKYGLPTGPPRTTEIPPMRARARFV